MTNDTHKQLEDAQTVIQVYRDALASAKAEVERLTECLAILRAENPQPKRRQRKTLQTFVRTY
jgi:hypothetical protein